MSHPFTPDWVIAPAETLREWMQLHGLTTSTLAVTCAGRTHKDLAVQLINDVLERKPMTTQHAEMLFRGTGINSHLWLNLEHDYRAGLAAGLKDTSDG